MFSPANGTSVVVVVVVVSDALTARNRKRQVSVTGDSHAEQTSSSVLISARRRSFVSIISSFLFTRWAKGDRLHVRGPESDFRRIKKRQDIPRRSAGRTILAAAFKPRSDPRPSAKAGGESGMNAARYRFNSLIDSAHWTRRGYRASFIKSR